MSPRLASLAMYDGGALTAANDTLWAAIAERLGRLGVRDVPAGLERDLSLAEVWGSERLLFGQTCGYPFAARYRGTFRLLASPVYTAPGCSGAEHVSFVVVSARSAVRELGALRGARAVINDPESMTGRHLLGNAIAGVGGRHDFFAHVETSGSHAQSLARVASREADVAAIDCVTHAHLAEAHPELVAETRVVHQTRPTPTLPFVISAACGEEDAALVARALYEAFEDPATATARRVLRLVGLRQLAPRAYDVTLDVAARADRVLLPA